MLPDLKHCQGEKDLFFSCNNNTRWTLGKKKNKGKKNYMSIKAGISLYKTPCAWWMKKKFIQTLGNVPSRYARNFLLVCYVSNKWRQKMGDKNRVKNIQEPRGLPPPFFPFGRRRGTLGGFFWILMFPMCSHQVMGTHPGFESESIYKQW